MKLAKRALIILLSVILICMGQVSLLFSQDEESIPEKEANGPTFKIRPRVELNSGYEIDTFSDPEINSALGQLKIGSDFEISFDKDTSLSTGYSYKLNAFSKDFTQIDPENSNQEHGIDINFKIRFGDISLDLKADTDLNFDLIDFFLLKFIKASLAPEVEYRFGNNAKAQLRNDFSGKFIQDNINRPDSFLTNKVDINLKQVFGKDVEGRLETNYSFKNFLFRTSNTDKSQFLNDVGTKIGFIHKVSSGFAYLPRVGVKLSIDDNQTISTNGTYAGPTADSVILYNIFEGTSLKVFAGYDLRLYQSQKVDREPRRDNLFSARVSLDQKIWEGLSAAIEYTLVGIVSNKKGGSNSDNKILAGLKYSF